MHEESFTETETILTYIAATCAVGLAAHYGFKAYDAMRRRRIRKRTEEQVIRTMETLDEIANMFPQEFNL